MDESNSTLTIRLTGSIASTLCLAVITLILLLLIFHKAYTSTLQRLLLYLMIFAVIQEACMTAGYTTQFEYSEHEIFCDMISIVWQWSTTVGYLLTLVMIVYLPYKVYKQFRGDPFPRLSTSNCCRIAMECFFIFIVLAFPLTYTLPFANCGYLLLQPQLCRISLKDHFANQVGENCTNQLIILSLVPGIVSFIDFVGIFVITIVLSVVFCCLAREYRETRKALCRTVVLLGFFVPYPIIGLVFFGVLFGKRDILSELLIYLGVVYPAMFPIIQLMFPLGFLFYLYSFHLFCWRAIKRAAAEWRCFHSCCGKENAPQEAATAPGSHCVTAPSVTFFDGANSKISTDVPNEEQALLPDGGGDRGHGTIMNS